jgi:hypothetical protein
VLVRPPARALQLASCPVSQWRLMVHCQWAVASYSLYPSDITYWSISRKLTKFRQLRLLCDQSSSPILFACRALLIGFTLLIGIASGHWPHTSLDGFGLTFTRLTHKCSEDSLHQCG